MRLLASAAVLAGALALSHVNPATAAGIRHSGDLCSSGLMNNRAAHSSSTGSAFVNRIKGLRGPERDNLVIEQVLAGNVPDFLRDLSPVTLSSTAADGVRTVVTICVTPDYLSVGTDADYVRVPMGLPAASRIAGRLGFLLPTTRMVDAIYRQAAVHLAPAPMAPTSQMESTDYFWRHNHMVDKQLNGSGPSLLTAGQKKDIVLTNRLRSKPGRVAIYGWHRLNGNPIQPLSTVHGRNYADYSHGVRLVDATAYVNGEPQSLEAILQDPELASIVSSEGRIPQPEELLASLR